MAFMIRGGDGNMYGPADQQTLTQWAAEGRIQRQSQIQDQSTGAFMVAESLPFLAAVWQ